MELRYVVIMLLKILISTPSLIILNKISGISGAALLGKPLSNRTSSIINTTETLYDYYITGSQELDEQDSGAQNAERTESEQIPDPSPLVLPGYNLPENIFNRGKPFYVEKDPLTGQIDFSNKSPSVKLDDDMYEYIDEEPSDNIYDKANIDRKDGSVGGHHRPSDVNQLTPNFHDFLNLPVKYNPDKYVYPLISNSYASTKIQGSVNKYHNHKDYAVKTTTFKPTVSPTYYSTNSYFSKVQTTPASTTSTTSKSTPKRYPDVSLTTKPTNLLNSSMAHPSFNEEFEDYYDSPTTTPKKTPNEIYLTTENVDHIYLTSKAPTTTKKVMSLFEQLFGDYDETVATVSPIKTTPPSLFANLPNNKYKNKYQNEVKIVKPSYTISSSTTTTTTAPTLINSHITTNVLTGSHMGLDSNYEYDYEGKYEDNVASETKPVSQNIEDDLKIEPLHVDPNYSVSDTKTTKGNVINENVTDTYTDYDYPETTIAVIKATSKPNLTTVKLTTTTVKPVISTTLKTETVRVTSLPLGENHITSSTSHDPIGRDPIIVATQNLREKLNSEKVIPKPVEKTIPSLNPPSTSNIRIAHDQDTVSFVVGNQQNVDGGQYVGTSLKGSPYDSNPFRPLYGHQATYTNDNSVSYTIQAEPEATYQLSPPASGVVGSAVTIQPMKNSEASLAIGVPIESIKQVPGQVVDEKLEVDNPSKDQVETSGNKVVFPSDNQPSEFPDLVPPPRQPIRISAPNNDILSFNSKPLYHQLPSDLTPPKEKDIISPPPRIDYNRPVRPPWDPRPGHFHSGKPEYNRPPRPDVAYKRIDNLPNILPQFRPNMKKHGGPPNLFFHDNKLLRQPLLERPSNRPIGFFENLHPPPPPYHSRPNIQLRNPQLPVSPPNQFLDDTQIAEDRIINDDQRRHPQSHEQFGFYQTPPQIKIANRRNDDDAEVETLQMIQAKHAEKNEQDDEISSKITQPPSDDNTKANTEKSIYKVYPVNTPPIKMDVIDNDKKETVVVGTRAELPLPPSKINTEFVYDQNPLFIDQKDRNDAPILRPHPRPSTYPIKSDFPYPLERPDSSLNHPAVPETPSKNGNDLEDLSPNKFDDEHHIYSNNQWNSIGENLESRIVTGQKVHAPSNQISVTLKTYTDKPIAIAYTPTDPNFHDKYSLPNYGSPVIPEIRPGFVESNNGGNNKEFTVSAMMHTHSLKNGVVGTVENVRRGSEEITNYKSDSDTPNYPKLDFEAPFQASVNLDNSIKNGWSVVRDKNKTTTESSEATTIPYATTSEFDIENFKPQLEGGFKPIYTFPQEKTEEKVNEREE